MTETKIIKITGQSSDEIGICIVMSFKIQMVYMYTFLEKASLRTGSEFCIKLRLIEVC